MSFYFDKNNVFHSGSSIEKIFVYRGKPEKIILYPGKYKFDLYGANGGYSHGGKGGHVSATFLASKTTELFLYIGGAGKSGAEANGGEGGWNGGGSGGNRLDSCESGGGGGGATDIRSIAGSWNANLEKRIIVAGGGGGGSGHPVAHGGDGGSLDGSNSFKSGGDNLCPNMGSNGGKRVSGYAFGYGQNGKNGNKCDCCFEGSGGGGGGWFGGNVKTDDSHTFGGGGGSGYISPILLDPAYGNDKNTRSDGNGYIVINNAGMLPTKVCGNCQLLAAIVFLFLI